MNATQRLRTGRSSEFYDDGSLVSVKAYGAKGDGVTDDTAAIQAAAAASLNLLFPPGTYLITAALSLSTSSYWKFDNATLSMATSTLAAISADRVDDWAIEGPLTIVGSGSTVGTAKGIYANACQRFSVSYVKCQTIKGWGFLLDSGGVGPPISLHGDRGLWTDCAAHSCYIGMEASNASTNNGAEYNTFLGFVANSCGTGAMIEAGNVSIIGGSISDNTAGLYIGAGYNNAHGQIVGVTINHNSTYNVKFDGVTNGETLIGCEIYANNNSSGYVWFVDSKGCKVIGGFLSSPIKNDGTTGQNVIVDNYIPDAVSDTIAGTHPEMIWFHDNWKDDGPWANNDPAWTYVEVSRTTSDQNMTSGSVVTLLFNNVVKDKKNTYNTGTGQFTAPNSGRFRIQWSLVFTYAAAGLPGYMNVTVNGASVLAYSPIVPIDTTFALANGILDVQMAAGDTLELAAFTSGTSPKLFSARSLMQISSFDGGK